MAPLTALVLADTGPDVPLEQLLRTQPLDVVLCLGDLTRDQLAPLREFDGAKLGVHGNHDDGDEFDDLGIEDLHLRTAAIDSRVLGGFSGSHRYRGAGRFAWTQEESVLALRDFEPVDVMLAHSPPLGVNDEPDDPAHVGLRGLREYVERTRPLALLHGHTYPTFGRARLGRTLVRHSRGAAVVQLP
jgi:uncharacterized protein